MLLPNRGSLPRSALPDRQSSSRVLSSSRVTTALIGPANDHAFSGGAQAPAAATRCRTAQRLDRMNMISTVATTFIRPWSMTQSQSDPVRQRAKPRRMPARATLAIVKVVLGMKGRPCQRRKGDRPEGADAGIDKASEKESAEENSSARGAAIISPKRRNGRDPLVLYAAIIGSGTTDLPSTKLSESDATITPRSIRDQLRACSARGQASPRYAATLIPFRMREEDGSANGDRRTNNGSPGEEPALDKRITLWGPLAREHHRRNSLNCNPQNEDENTESDGRPWTPWLTIVVGTARCLLWFAHESVQRPGVQRRATEGAKRPR